MISMRRLLIAASFALVPAGVFAQAGGDGANFAGDVTDPITGYPCADRFCISVRPNNDCVCQKLNPGETDLSRVRFTCVGEAPACPAVLLQN